MKVKHKGATISVKGNNMGNIKVTAGLEGKRTNLVYNGSKERLIEKYEKLKRKVKERMKSANSVNQAIRELEQDGKRMLNQNKNMTEAEKEKIQEVVSTKKRELLSKYNLQGDGKDLLRIEKAFKEEERKLKNKINKL